jgi:hypothetical protein
LQDFFRHATFDSLQKNGYIYLSNSEIKNIMKKENVNIDERKYITCYHKPSKKLIAFEGESFKLINALGWQTDFANLEEPKDLEGVLLTYNSNKNLHEITSTSKIKTSINELEAVAINTIY